MKQPKSNPFNNPEFIERLHRLRFLQANGKISELELFQKVKLTASAVPWKCPFVYVDDKGVKTYEAFKVGRCPVFKVIVRLWVHYGPGRLLVTQYKGGELVIDRVVEVLTKVNLARRNEGE